MKETRLCLHGSCGDGLQHFPVVNIRLEMNARAVKSRIVILEFSKGFKGGCQSECEIYFPKRSRIPNSEIFTAKIPKRQGITLNSHTLPSLLFAPCNSSKFQHRRLFIRRVKPPIHLPLCAEYAGPCPADLQRLKKIGKSVAGGRFARQPMENRSMASDPQELSAYKSHRVFVRS